MPAPALTLAFGALAFLSAAAAQRTAHLPRPELERPGRGAAEAPIDASSALFDTLEAGARASVPAAALPALAFRPKASAAVVSGSSFVADVRGDYVLPLAPPAEEAVSAAPAPAPASLCDDGAPALSTGVTSLRISAWDFEDPATASGEIFADAFTHGGVTSSETQFELWGGGSGGGAVPACASEADGALSLGAAAGGACGIATRAARVNPFSEPIKLTLHALSVPAAAGAAFAVTLVDAYDGVANLTLELVADKSFRLTAGAGKVLASGPTGGVCSSCLRSGQLVVGALPALDVTLTCNATTVGLVISCSGGAPGTPVNSTGVRHGLSYSAFGRGASGAMRVALSAAGATSTLRGAAAASLAAAAKAPFELFPLAGRGAFSRLRLGASQPRAAIGVVDASAPPFGANASGAAPATRG